MSRAERLLQLMQVLRCHRHPVRGEALAAELQVSLRTLYRDIAALQAQGAHIEGEPGMGYVLRPGFVLPPLMLDHDELQALILGTRWVAERADPLLARAARQALAKVAAVLPPAMRHELDAGDLLVGPGEIAAGANDLLQDLRRAIRAEVRVALDYEDLQQHVTRRVVWPCALAFFDHVRVLVAWCELRGDFRHFRTDRIRGLDTLDDRYPRRRLALLREWRQRQGGPELNPTADRI